MKDDLQKLIEAAKSIEITEEQRESQRRSFAYGNTNIENDRITKATIDEEAERLKRERE